MVADLEGTAVAAVVAEHHVVPRWRRTIREVAPDEVELVAAVADFVADAAEEVAAVADEEVEVALVPAVEAGTAVMSRLKT